MRVPSIFHIATFLAFFAMGVSSASIPGQALGVNGDYRTRERTPLFFGSEKEAMQSREFKKCSFSNTCLLIRNGHNSNLAIWGEITVGGKTQFVSGFDNIYVNLLVC